MRHEIKFEISRSDYLALRHRLSALFAPDQHVNAEGEYRVRSLYFDTLTDRALNEKREGIAERAKYRIRYYEGDLSHIRLEKKSKRGALTEKQSAPITVAQVEAVLLGDMDSLCGHPLLDELRQQATHSGLREKAIVEYIRAPYLFPPGNVRVTLDRAIRAGAACSDFLRDIAPLRPVGEAYGVLEVKYDQFLPDVVKAAVQLPGRRAGAFSKYLLGRTDV